MPVGISLLERLRAKLREAAGDETLYQPRTLQQSVSASVAQQRFL